MADPTTYRRAYLRGGRVRHLVPPGQHYALCGVYLMVGHAGIYAAPWQKMLDCERCTTIAKTRERTR